MQEKTENDVVSANKVKEDIGSLDLRFLVKELRPNLINGAFRKIYQYRTVDAESKPSFQFLFEVFLPGKGEKWIYVDKNKIFITRNKKPVPIEPPNFCMFLRKYLMGKKIRELKQYEFDRIIKIFTNDHVLIFELFHPGNVILCDSSYNIIMPLQIQKWKDREVKPKIPYKHPPRYANPFELSFDDLRKYLKMVDKKTVVFLSINMGFGSTYANEICFRANIDGNKNTSIMIPDEILRLHEVIMKLDKFPNPCIYSNFVSPIKLGITKETPKETVDFSSALDDYYSEQIEHKEEEKKEEIIKEQEEKITRIIDHQKEAENKWEKIGEESKEIAETIYMYYTTVSGILEAIKSARNSNTPWPEIKERIEKEDTPEANAVTEIRENDGIIVLDLGGKKVEIDIRKSVEENAAKYYEDVKWAKKKLEGVEGAMENQEKKLEETKEGKIDSEETKQEPEEEEKPKWYEKFKWFFSSDGILVIAGRNAEQNDLILKKHTNPNEFVFHADIVGAAFVVIKAEGKEVMNETKKEAAEFAAANCKAWNKGLGTVDIFCVKREALSKTPPSGQHLEKGSFVVQGEKEWFRELELKLSIGVRIDEGNKKAKVISGPVMAMRKNSQYFMTIKPGFKKSLELARSIKNKILIKAKPEDKFLIEKLPLEDFQKVIPAGMGEIVEYG